MKQFYIISLQVVIVTLCFPVFYYFGKTAAPLNSFVLSFFAYWILISISSFFIILFDDKIARQLKKYFLLPKRKFFIFINFIPPVAVLLLVFIPNLSLLNSSLVTMIVLIALFNGFFEELFWRGIVLAKYSHSVPGLIMAVIFFTVFHMAFLLLPLSYHGGALNLVGGAAFMGVLWLVTAKLTQNISFTILAHILVNFFAFCGLFIDNHLLP